VGHEFAELARVAGVARVHEGATPKEVRRLIRRSLARAKSNRVGQLRGYGNAIVPQVAATFIRCVMEEIEVLEETFATTKEVSP